MSLASRVAEWCSLSFSAVCASCGRVRDSFLHLQCAATASRCTAMSVLVARLACLIGFLLLGYAAVDTIECACTTAAAAAAAVSSHGEPRLTQRTRFLLLQTGTHYRCPTRGSRGHGRRWVPRFGCNLGVGSTPVLTRSLRVPPGCGRAFRGLAAGAVRCVWRETLWALCRAKLD